MCVYTCVCMCVCVGVEGCDSATLRYSCERFGTKQLLMKKKLTFKIQEKIGLLFQVCAS